MARLTISLADRTHRALKEAAARQNRSMASIIEESLELRGIRPYDTALEIVARVQANSRLNDDDAIGPGGRGDKTASRRAVAASPAAAVTTAVTKGHGRGPMKPGLCIVDTNVVVSGLIGSTSGPPARILRAMLGGDLSYLMSSDLLGEYSSALRRPNLVRSHGRTNEESDRLLADLVANAMWRDPRDRRRRPGP